jgi:hypothetical protein
MRNLLHPWHLPQTTVLRLSVVFVTYAGLALFSAYCGYLLWSENPRGPRVTKAYLVIAAVIVIMLYSMLAMSGMEIDLFKIVTGRLVYTVCWYAYLVNSVRVKLTYETHPVTSAVSPSSPGVVSP